MIGGTPNLLVCRPSLPVGTLAEFVAYARAQPDKVNYGTSGKGTLNHLVMEQFKNAAGGIVGPARLPGAIVRQLNDEINRMLAQPDFRDRLSAEALDPMPMTPPQFGEYIAAEIRHWTAVAQANRITGD